MSKITLGEDVRSVRSKLGIEDISYSTAWRTLNAKAQEICLKRYGNASLKEAGILSGVDELKDYYKANEAPLSDPKASGKIVEVLQVEGAAAWIIHNAVKRNYDKHRKATQSSTVSSQDATKTGSSAADENTKARKVMWDPARNL